MCKNNTKQRIVVIATLAFFVIGIITFDAYDWGLCGFYKDTCNLEVWQSKFMDLLFAVPLSLFFMSLFTLFISDRIFKQWCTFAIAWMIVTIVFVMLFGKLLFIGPNRDLISILMSVLFVIISSVMFIGMTTYEKRCRNSTATT